jgi:hypothetical protein
MNLKRSPGPATSRKQLLDAVIDGYVTWREESHAVAVSYRNWRCAGRDERGSAVDAYFAALDREEHAAAAYRRLVEQVAA